LAQTAPAKVLPPAKTASAVPAKQAAKQPINEPINEAEATDRGEPNVKHIVIEDDGSKIEELRVRGETQQMVVTPKVGTTKSYEIIVNRGGRNQTDGTGGAQGAVGKRVWNVLKF
jgi:hypothetical protein